ncbi:MAG: hypothetical protein RJA49_848 [Actinomycetota bacterium]|jgi:exopolyphosphatase/guanosine-5'-triphosphate,3'-diphosphate pyrophosphatase
MSTLHITLAPRTMRFAVEEHTTAVPIGPAGLNADLEHDPPSPEELTNAIGLVWDHMEDVERETPGISFVERVEIAGEGVEAVAAVELGGAPTLPFELSRDAAEDVFRTMVTERAADRARNPGLQPDMVQPVLGVVCALVGVMRFLRVESVWLVAA